MSGFVDLVQTLLDGLMYGASYALIGLGFTLMFGVMRRLNLAYGPTILVGVYCGTLAATVWRLPFLVATSVAVLAAALVGRLVELLCFRALRSPDPLTPLVSTFGFWMLLEELVIRATGAQPQRVPNPLAGAAFELGPFSLRGDYLGLLVLAGALTGLLYLFVYRTELGFGIRAIAEDARAARVIGLDVDRVSGAVFALASAVGGATGFALATSVGYVSAEFGLSITLKGLVVMVVGGLGSIPGAIVGGLLLGIVELQAVALLGASYRDLVAYILLFVLLLIRPTGLLGEHLGHA